MSDDIGKLEIEITKEDGRLIVTLLCTTPQGSYLISSDSISINRLLEPSE